MVPIAVTMMSSAPGTPYRPESPSYSVSEMKSSFCTKPSAARRVISRPR